MWETGSHKFPTFTSCSTIIPTFIFYHHICIIIHLPSFYMISPTVREVVEMWRIFIQNFFRNTYRFCKILFYTPTLPTFPQMYMRYRKPSSIRYSRCKELENLWETGFHKFPTSTLCPITFILSHSHSVFLIIINPHQKKKRLAARACER